MLKVAFQKTIARETEFSGIGLHSGVESYVKLKPAKADTGIVFLRKDKDKDIYKSIPADYKFISKSNLCTTLESFDSSFKLLTVEHLLAAVKGNEIDNLVIEVSSSSEIPALDGSAIEFDNIIKKAGVLVQREKYKKYLLIKKKLEVKQGISFIEVMPSTNFSIDCTIDFPEPIGKQNLYLGNSIKDIYEEVLEARTFCFYNDIKGMQNIGLAQGGSLKNALVIKNNKVLNKEGLRNEKEFVQHKILDMIGDLALINYNLRCSIKAYCPGHAINKQLMNKIFSTLSNYEIQQYRDTNTENFPEKSIVAAQL